MVGDVERPLVEDDGVAVEEGADEAVPGRDRPRHIGGAPDDRARAHRAVHGGGLQEDTRDRVLRETGGGCPGRLLPGAENVVRRQRRGPERGCGLDRGLGRGVTQQIRVPDVPVEPGHVHSGPADDDGGLDAGGAGQGLVRPGLERQDRAPAPRAVLGEEDGGGQLLDAQTQGLRRQRHRQHGPRGADAHARDHRDDGLREPARVQRHDVARAYAQPAQGVDGAVDLVRQLRVREAAAVAGLALPVDRDAVAVRLRVPVDQVPGDVDRAAGAPGAAGSRRGRRLPYGARRGLPLQRVDDGLPLGADVLGQLLQPGGCRLRHGGCSFRRTRPCAAGPRRWAAGPIRAGGRR